MINRFLPVCRTERFFSVEFFFHFVYTYFDKIDVNLSFSFLGTKCEMSVTFRAGSVRKTTRRISLVSFPLLIQQFTNNPSFFSKHHGFWSSDKSKLNLMFFDLKKHLKLYFSVIQIFFNFKLLQKDLSEPVDVYSDWIDACEEANNWKCESKYNEIVRRDYLSILYC